MADVHRADVLVRWVGLLPFLRGTPAPEQRAPSDTPWQTGRRRPTRPSPDDGDAPRPGPGPARPEPTPGPEPTAPAGLSGDP
ncbi:hypothetical protein LWC33_29580, partial [Pseudonocardia sp. RS11V-5]|nr:hypothetical protein [Pseudonocardia terrae]